MQHTIPSAEFRISLDANLAIWYWQVSRFGSKKMFLQYQNTTGTLEHHHDTTETPRKHEQDPEHHPTPSGLTDTPPKVPPRHQRPLQHNLETTKTPAEGQTP